MLIWTQNMHKKQQARMGATNKNRPPFVILMAIQRIYELHAEITEQYNDADTTSIFGKMKII
jgi:hypothetical protein